MGFIYTPQEIRREMESDPKHGAIFAFVLKEFDARGFSMGVQPLGIFTSWQASARGVTVDTGARDIATAARWAKNGLREWAYLGIQGTNTYFGEVARAWSKSQKASCTKCIGSTVDFLYLFSMSMADSGASGIGMYQISSSINRDLKGILLWVFVGWWDVGVVQGFDSTPVQTDQTDLHRDYHDSQPNHYDEDQTHHFALYFYVGVKVGSDKFLLKPVLKRTHDIDDDGNITNEGDYYLGLTAARLGDDFDNRPRFVGAEITRALQQPSPDKLEDEHDRNRKYWANVWINPDREVVHPESPVGKGGPGRFAWAKLVSFEPEPGGLPHPNSPAARTLDPLEIDRYRSRVTKA